MERLAKTVEEDTEVSLQTHSDNWGVVAKGVRAAPIARQSVVDTEKFTKEVGMVLSPDKGWLWGAAPADRKVMGGLVIGGEKVPVKLDARDLGAHQRYSKQPRNKTLKDRITKVLKVMGRIGAPPIQEKDRVRLMRVKVWPALYGHQITKINSTLKAQLRSEATTAVWPKRSKQMRSVDLLLGMRPEAVVIWALAKEKTKR